MSFETAFCRGRGVGVGGRGVGRERETELNFGKRKNLFRYLGLANLKIIWKCYFGGITPRLEMA